MATAGCRGQSAEAIVMATGAANQAKVLGALAASFPIAYVMWQVTK